MKTFGRGLAVVAITLLAGCGQLGLGGSAEPSPTTLSDAEVLAIGKEVAQCFRDNGIPEFPDPIIDDNGQLQLPDETEAQIESRYPEHVLEQAQQACQSIFDRLPESAIGGGGGGDQQAPGPGDVEALRKFAECARQNGIPDFPDPKPDGSFPMRGTPLEAEGKSDRMLRVFDACNKFWDGGFTIS